MALVGPRPALPAHLDHFDLHGHPRFSVLPGITGWAQVKGRADIPWEKRVELDAWYMEHRSALLDLWIIARTIWLVANFRRLALTRPGAGKASNRRRI
jgi:lipopolysaccharide/colanic/teichoic acid biosynthesis glycosyltransferase